MSNEELIREKKKLLYYWQEEARKKTSDLGKTTQKANQLQREIYELENVSRIVTISTEEKK